MNEHNLHGLHPSSAWCYHLWPCTMHANENCLLQHGTWLQNQKEWLIVSCIQTQRPNQKIWNLKFQLQKRHCHIPQMLSQLLADMSHQLGQCFPILSHVSISSPCTTAKNMNPTASCRCRLEWRSCIHATQEVLGCIRVCDYVGWHLPRNNFLQYYVHLWQWHMFFSDVSLIVNMPMHNTGESML